MKTNPAAASSPTRDLNRFFEIEEVDKSFVAAVNKRRPPIRPLKGIPNADIDYMRRKAFEKWGLEDYLPCWTGEMAKRPIPFISTDERPLRVLEKFERYIGPLMDCLLPRMQPHTQTYNKISKVGYPVNSNPEDEEGNLIKMDVLMEHFPVLLNGDDSLFKDTYTTIGTRLQNESPSKTRLFQFIDNDGSIYEEEIDRRNYKIKVPQVGEMVPSRTRTVNCPDLRNLLCQVFDTMLHRAIMESRLCEANIYTKETWPSNSNFRSFDCKHYERYLGMLVFKYASTVGGAYEKWLTEMTLAPYLVPSDTWKRFFMVKPKYQKGVYPQFGSGLCCVATLGKLANMCVRIAFYVEVYSMTVSDAIQAMISGEHDGLRHWMYGDDNQMLGNDTKCDQFIAYFGQYFDIEEDEISRFLGTIWRADIGRKVLPRDTYNLKLYQPERDYSFKSYPFLGYTERRKTFSEYGEPEIARDIIPYEDQLYEDVGHPWYEVVAASVKERMKVNDPGFEYLVTDKEYLMTAEEQLASGEFWGLPPMQTREIVLSIVSETVRNKFKFK